MKLLSLRENATTKNQTSLKDYMNYVFPEDEVVCDERIPDDIQIDRCNKFNVKYNKNKYRPDARIESRSLIVEFEGVQHFQNVSTIYKDDVRDDYLTSIGYKVVRIPFYVQLTTDMIKFYFDVDVKYGSEVKSGFYSLTSDPAALNPNCPASFSILGYQKFLNNFRDYPESTKQEIIDSLRDQQINHPGILVLPNFLAVDQILIESRCFLDEKHMFMPFLPRTVFEPDGLYEIHEDGSIEHWT